MTSIQFKIGRTLVGLLSVSLTLPLSAFADNSDDFNDNSKDTTKWGADAQEHSPGVLTEQNQRLEYTATIAANGDRFRPWILERFPVDGDWTVQVDVQNSTVPSGPGNPVNSAGFSLFHPNTTASEIYIEVYAVPLSKAANTVLITDATELSFNDVNIASNNAANAAVRLEYNSTNRVVSCFYDSDISNGYQWTSLASFGLAGAGGATVNTDWELSTNQQFAVWVYGFSDNMPVASGELYLDNFEEIGGETPTSTPSPIPTGHFGFSFPTNNLLLTRIMSIIGSYQGVSPTAFQRNYSVDVAQDESGKLAIMGTMDGIEDEDGNSDITVATGTTKTVDGEPEAKIKTRFKGARDSATATFSGTGTIPVEVIDVGGGTNGIGATVSYKSKVSGVPFGERNLPLLLAAPPGAEDNLQHDWSFQLDITNTVVNSKTVTVASAELLLPNGDTIVYPGKKVRYSATRGYNLSFRKGTNTTVNPPAVDKKTKLSIKGLNFDQSGSDWIPNAGTIDYRFLGQKGKANLLDFEAP